MSRKEEKPSSDLIYKIVKNSVSVFNLGKMNRKNKKKIPT